MDSRELNSVQVLMLVARLLSERQFDELGALARRDERVLHQLVEVLGEGEGIRCFFAATSLIKAGEPAVAPLLAALEDEKYAVRQAAAMALGDVGDRRAVAGLVGRLGDASYEVRQAAAVSLGKLGAAEAVGSLIETMDDEHELVRKAAINGLGMIGDRRALPAHRRAAAAATEAVAERARAVIEKIEADAAPWWRRMWQKRR